jgi:WhiB family redox-sensing transcriptional regulator
MNELEQSFAALSKATEWTSQANCKNMDIDLFFPGDGENYSSFVKEVCQECPVIEECLWYANETRSYDGYFGGMSPNARERWRVKNKITMGHSREQHEEKFMNYLRTPTDRWEEL